MKVLIEIVLKSRERVNLSTNYLKIKDLMGSDIIYKSSIEKTPILLGLIKEESVDIQDVDYLVINSPFTESINDKFPGLIDKIDKHCHQESNR